MPIVEKNLGKYLAKDVAKQLSVVQYPFGIEAKTFASIFILEDFKITKVVASVVNISTTQTSFSVVIPGDTITVTIIAGENNSDIWSGEKIITAGNNMSCKINGDGTGSFLTMVIEGEWI
ncbi:MAG: hypothetical protein AB1567_08470 [bacterium]